jgi:transposase-like protein
VSDAVEDYPHTLRDFEARFGTDEACHAYLVQLRWGDGFRCPRCGGVKAWPVRRLLYQCVACDRQTSVTAGTILQDTRTPLTTWFRAIWWVSSQRTGASAVGLQEVLGLGSYETAWTWLHKLRRAMVRPGRDQLSGTVEVDETYLGAIEEGVHGRHTVHKALIAVAAEEHGRGIGRIRLRRIADLSASSLHRFIADAAAPGSVIHTDGWRGYWGLEERGYQHDVTVLRGRQKSPSDLLPHVHRVVSLLKRWLLGTHQGAISHAHLDYYLDEFTFRFNRRRSRHRGKLFYRLLQQAMVVDPAPYRTLIKGVARPQRRYNG